MLRIVALVAAVGSASLFTHDSEASAAQGPQQQKVDTTITISATGSTLEFTPPELAVKQGKRVRLRFVNAGTLPHNIVFVHDGNDIDTLAAVAPNAYKTGYVPVQMKDKMIAYSTLASPGDTVEVTFVVPKPGEYTYVCLISGHATTMLGTLRSLR